MTPLSSLSADWPALSALLDEALALPPPARGAWLDGLSGEAAAHREALRTLLARQDELGTSDFLSTLPRLDVPQPPTASRELAPGASVGPYRLLAPLGRGGMGVVWLAERTDGMVNRRVALKLPHVAWNDTFSERLAREREILATLEHAHIARLYDAGADALGRPYLAMEYVEGRPIDAYCREHELPVRERLALLLQVMAAVAHAHSRLVVHRDLKPGNILVSGDAQVKLLDFGIAKLMEDGNARHTALTELSGRLLTLDYASPEQIRGEPLGTASDIYSLGVVAYELLAQARPYRLKRGTAAEMEEAIAAMEPLRASEAAASSTVAKALRGDLDAILHRALKKRADERYPSADAFAQDLQRHLRGEPVQARPDRRGYRIAKFVRRHRLPVAMASALAFSVVAGGAIATWQARVARQQERLASAEVARQAAVRDLYVEAMMRLSVLRARHPDQAPGPGEVTAALQQVLREMAPRLKDQPEAREAQLEAVMLQLLNGNEYEASLAVGREYLDALKARRAAPSRIIDAHVSLGRNLALLGRDDESEALRRAGVAWAADVHDARTELSRLNLAADLGRTLVARGKRDEAEAVLMRAEAIAAERFPNALRRYDNLMQLWVYWSDFDDARALQYARQAHAGARAAGTADPDEQAVDLRYLGTALSANGLQDEAEAAWRESLALYERTYGRDAAKSTEAVGRVAEALSRRGAYPQAVALLDEEAKRLAASSGGISPYATQVLRARQLENAWLAGDAPAATRWLATPAADLLARETLRNTQLLLSWQLRGLELAGRAPEALALVQAARQAWPDPGRPSSWWIRTLELQAGLQLATARPAEARTTARELLALLQAQRATGGRAWRVAAEYAAVAAARLGDAADAAEALARADAASPPVAFPSRVDEAESRLRRAEVLAMLGRAAESATTARAALADLAGQHADSPRLALARRIAGTAAP